MHSGRGRWPFLAPVVRSALGFIAMVGALSGCGIVASFDRSKLDAGQDSGLDAGADGAPDSAPDSTPDSAPDASADAGAD